MMVHCKNFKGQCSRFNLFISLFFSKEFGIVGSMKNKEEKVLKKISLETPIGSMLAIGDENFLYLLEFVERKGLEQQLERLQKGLGALIVLGTAPPLLQIQEELRFYFARRLKEFKTPLFVMGSLFQKRVWEELQKISLGKTASYLEIAEAIGRPTACRAVAQANSRNRLALIIPCHRVINTGGALGGYAGGLDRKEWLLQHEKSF